MRHVDLHVQLDRLTSLAKVLCHSPLGKQMLIEARERKWRIQDGSPLWVILGNFVEATIDFGWVWVE